MTLIPADPERRIGHRARYRDPDSDKLVKVSLDVALRTVEMREDWAARKSKAIAKRRLELEQGHARATGTALSEAIKRYYEAHTRLRENTLTSYKAATSKLLVWAERNGIKSGDDLTRAKLLGFREELIAEPKRTAAPAAKRGARRVTAVLSYDGAAAAAKRLKKNFGAPAAFGWQQLRSTCGTFLTNSPGIFGAASAYRSARQLGHSVTVAEKHYLGLIRIAPEAKTLEAAMGIETQIATVTEAAGKVTTVTLDVTRKAR
ncbi:MAG: hypothetical protein ABI627_28715 [Polyangiaceae bacterium]